MLTPAHKGNGFTLLELMITLAVAAILVTVAVPSMSRLIRESQASAANNDLVYALQLARSEAVTRKLPVSVCASAGATCTGNNDWEKGWMVFSDPNGDGDCTDNDGDRNCADAGRILHRVRDVSGNFTLLANGEANDGRVVFDPNGFVAGISSRFTLCDGSDRVKPRGFTLQNSGRISPTTDPGELLPCP